MFINTFKKSINWISSIRICFLFQKGICICKCRCTCGIRKPDEYCKCLKKAPECFHSIAVEVEIHRKEKIEKMKLVPLSQIKRNFRMSEKVERRLQENMILLLKNHALIHLKISSIKMSIFTKTIG